MIRATEASEIQGASKRGPKSAGVEAAQAAVDEFLASDLDACEVDWEQINPDFNKAKRCLNYRIGYTKERGIEGSADLSFRSNREKGKVYIIHGDRFDGEA